MSSVVTPRCEQHIESTGGSPRCRFEITPGRTKLYIPSCPNHLKPKKDMVFSSIEEGINFYNRYADACGFQTRLGGTYKSNIDDTLLLRYVVCNKEGFKRQKKTDPKCANLEVSEASSSVVQKRRRLSTRVGCKASICFKFVSNNSYCVMSFEERHTHLCSTPDDIQFVRRNRKLNVGHQKFIVDCSRVNIGPVKSYRLYKEIVGGYQHVGATDVDFKNFQRDLKAYIGGSDAQMVIDNFFNKQQIWSAFYFDYDVDATDTLTRLFWADPISRKNYALFGDMVSVDAIYTTNRYNMIFVPFTGVDHHKKCITFGVGLIGKEDVDSYVWLFATFLKAMGHQPTCIISDQDPSMKIAIARVFDKTKHRFCMWHIMDKLPKRVGPFLCSNTDFLSKLNAVVWSHFLDPTEFEEKWKSVISEYDLNNNSHLTRLFENRSSWIPAYFRDLKMGGLLRTTSRSESENNFFGNFTNPFVTLVEFVMRFDSAMDSQRQSQAKLNYDSKNAFPELKTPLLIEKDASERYTPSVFYDIQEDISAACFSCGVESLSREDDVSIYFISEPNKRSFKVAHNHHHDDVSCSCKQFERIGLLCRHIFYVLRRADKLPSKYVLNRWTKTALGQPIFDIDGNVFEDSSRMEGRKLILNDLWSEIHSSLSLAEQNDDDLMDMLQHIKTFKSNLIAKRGAQGQPSKSQVIESLIGVSAPKEVRILPPRVSKNKGSGTRLKGVKDIASEENQKNKRHCRRCGKLGFHDSRTCPTNESS